MQVCFNCEHVRRWWFVTWCGHQFRLVNIWSTTCQHFRWHKLVIRIRAAKP